MVYGTTSTIGRTHQNPLVGRDAEREMLLRLLLDAEQQIPHVTHDEPGEVQQPATFPSLPLDTLRRPQCVVLMGEAGIGKTRLAEEVSRVAQQRGWMVMWSRAYAQESGIPYRLWTDTLRKVLVLFEMLHKQESEGQRTREEAFPASIQPLSTLLPELQTVPFAHAVLTVALEQEPLRLRIAARDLLVAVSEQTPLVIVLDDMQWADASSCDMWGYIARHIHGYPILLIATCREYEIAAHPLQRLIDHMQREHTIKSVRVQPLSEGEIGVLVSHLPHVEETRVAHIRTQAAGNPFFAEELARTIPPELPRTVEAALEHRMNRLSRACRQLLDKASVLGGSFDLFLICSMEAKGDVVTEEQVLDLLDEALQAGVLTEEGGGARITYHFWHPLLVSHLYDHLSAMRRTRLHRQAADIVQNTAIGHEDEVAATIAHHLIHGDAEVTRIAYYAELAAERAYALSAYPEAERHYRLAVAYRDASVLVEDEENRQRPTPTVSSNDDIPHLAYLLERLAECTSILGNFAIARRLYERVLAVRGSMATSVSTPDQRHEAQIQALLWGEIGRLWRYIGNSSQAHACCGRGMEVLRVAGVETGSAWARLYYQQGGLYQHEGLYDEARTAVHKALALFTQYESTRQHTPATDIADMPSLARLRHMTRTARTLQGDPVDLGRTHAFLGILYDSIGQPDEALSHLQTAQNCYEQYDQKREIAHVSCNIGHIYVKMAQEQLAVAALNRSRSIAEQIGDKPLPAVIDYNMAALAFFAHDLVQAETLYRRALKAAEGFNDREYVSRWNVELAAVLQEQGGKEQIREARLCVARALRIGRSMHNTPCIGSALLALGNLYLSEAIQTSKKLSSTRTHLLEKAQHTIVQAQHMTGLEAETQIRGQLAHAQLTLLLGKKKQAQQEMRQVLERASACKLAMVERSAKEFIQKITGN